jgi:hypothetical protein
MNLIGTINEIPVILLYYYHVALYTNNMAVGFTPTYAASVIIASEVPS